MNTAKQSQSTLGRWMAGLFHMPDNSGKVYDPGVQPYSPGVSHIGGWNGGQYFQNIPWPNAVPSLNALANDPGTARARALQIDNNQYAFLPTFDLFLAGFVGKSQG